jgi:LysM repeat protein
MQLVENKQTSEEKSNGYTVKAGDTLYKISKRFNTTVEKIKQDNNLTTNDLKINQHLIVFSHY